MPSPTRTEYLDIDGTPIPCPAWDEESFLPLWEGPDVRGQDRTIPGTAGVKVFPRRATVSKRTLFLVIYGEVDVNGLATTDFRSGLRANIAYLRANVSDPTGVGDGTRTATYHYGDGTIISGKIHVEDLQLGEVGPFSVRATLDISIPLGALA